MISLVLPKNSNLISDDVLRPDVVFWCRERIAEGMRLLDQPDGWELIFFDLSDLLAFKARWIA